MYANLFIRSNKLFFHSYVYCALVFNILYCIIQLTSINIFGMQENVERSCNSSPITSNNYIIYFFKHIVNEEIDIITDKLYFKL